MKKIVTIISATILITGYSFSQNHMDALKFSQTFPGGTARSISMGGAFGALGGDFGSLSINPAGAGVYRKSEFTLSTGLDYAITSSKFLNNEREDFNYKFNLSNIGIIGVYDSGNEEGWVSTSFGVTYNRNNNFLLQQNIEGYDENSLVDYFLSYVSDNNGNLYDPGTLDPYYEKLAFEAYIIDTTMVVDEYGEPYLYEYWSPVPIGGVNKRNSLNISGRNAETVFTFGANYSNMLYLGAAFTINKIQYDYTSTHEETDINNLSTTFDWFTYTYQNETSGRGYSMKLGAILKPVQLIRVGIAIHTPTFYSLSDKFITSISSNFINETYEPLEGYKYYDYELVTPMKAVGSVGFQFGKIGLISMDIERINWDKLRFRNGGDGYDYYEENKNITEIYKLAYNIRLGGELRAGPFSLRGGYNSYGSPFESDEINDDAKYTGLSGGIGFRQNEFFVDFAAYQLIHKEKYFMYDYSTLPSAEITMNNLRMVATIGFKF